MKTLLIIAIIAAAIFVYDNLDYNCFSDCMNRGYTYNYCKSACSY